jgi:hypothetical protein
VASFATHIEGGVTAALLRDVQSLSVTIEAEILALIAGRGLQKLIFVVRLVRAVTLDAIADGGRMNGSLDGGRVHVGMTRDAQRLGRSGGQLNAGDVFVHPDFMTASTSGRNGGVNELALGFVLVTLDTRRRIGVWFQRNGMDASKQEISAGKESPHQNDPHYSGHNFLQPLPRNLCTMIAAGGGQRQESLHNQLSLST